MLNWLFTKILMGLLLKIGIKSSLASSLVPLIIRTIRDAKTAIDKAKAEGADDNEALADAADVILSPNHPDRKVTLEDIARGTPA